MLEISQSKSAASAQKYFREALVRPDYYLEGDGVAGSWRGLGAARLGLVGPVTADEFRALANNRLPDGSKLTERDGAKRRPGFDLTFSAPKSVSVLWGLTQDDRIKEAHRRAVRVAMAEVERDAQARVRAGGAAKSQQVRTTGNLIWAEFLHETSRPVEGLPDPQLHSHNYVMNATFDETEAKVKAVEPLNIHRRANFYDAVYLSALAAEMKALGFEIEREGRWWDVRGVSREVIELFSRRQAQVEATAKALGITDAQAKAKLGATTRERKTNDVLGAAYRDQWATRLSTRHAAEIDRVLRDAKRGPTGRRVGAVEAWAHALEEGFARQSVAPLDRLFEIALARGAGSVSLEDLRAAASMTSLVTTEIEGRVFCSTREILTQEESMIEAARRGVGACEALGHGRYEIANPVLNDEQRAAIRYIWESPDRVMLLYGGQGVGKTTLLEEAANGLLAAGHRVAAVAAQSGGVASLREKVDAQAMTLQRLLIDTDAQVALIGAVILVDEAGQVGVPSMAKLFELAERQDWRLVLVGDVRQHPPIERGDALRLLKERSGIRGAAVKTVVRQEGLYRDALAAFRAGDIDAGWARFAEMGAIIETTGDRRLDEVAADYLGEVDAGRSALVVAPTHAEKNAVSDRIRFGLKAMGRLTGPEQQIERLKDLQWSTAEKRDPANYRDGLAVRLWQNMPSGVRGRPLLRGERFEVVGVDDQRLVRIRDGAGEIYALPLERAEQFTVYALDHIGVAVGDQLITTAPGRTLDGFKFDTGRVFIVTGFTRHGDLMTENDRVLAQGTGHLDHAYAVTTYRAQGRDVRTIIGAMGAESFPAIDLESFFTASGRGQKAVRLYTDDADKLREAVAETATRASAVEMVEGELNAKLQPLRRKERISEFYSSFDRHLRALIERNPEGMRDQDLMREARQLAAAEYEGRLRERGAALGDD